MAVMLSIYALIFLSQIAQPGECHNRQVFFYRKEQTYLANHVIETKQAKTELECGLHCVADGSCSSVNYKTSGMGKGRCELNSKTLQEISDADESLHNPEFTHLYIIKKKLQIIPSSPPQTTQELSTIPGSCQNESWATSFDSAGWSTCPSTFPYINGLYRSSRVSGKDDLISNLDGATCCEGFKNIESECVEVDWLTSFDKKKHWNLCKTGYYLSGLHRSQGNNLHNIEGARCCKPSAAPDSNTTCYDEDVWASFDKKGTVSCTKAGYYITGLYRSWCNFLYCIDELRCCKL